MLRNVGVRPMGGGDVGVETLVILILKWIRPNQDLFMKICWYKTLLGDVEGKIQVAIDQLVYSLLSEIFETLINS